MKWARYRTNTIWYLYEECEIVKLIEAEIGMVVAKGWVEREMEKYYSKSQLHNIDSVHVSAFINNTALYA